MITKQSVFKILDNSGGITGQCIGLYKKKKYNLKLGDHIVVSIKSAKLHKKIKKHEVKSAIIINTKKYINRVTEGVHLRFAQNGIVLVNNEQTPIGSRLTTVLPKELRHLNQMKLIAMAVGVI
jgi:ribosomal protein L14